MKHMPMAVSVESDINELFSFEWCHCVHESGFSLVSLHKTKRGAVKSMIKTANARWQEMRDFQLSHGCFSRQRPDPLAYESWRVRALEVEA